MLTSRDDSRDSGSRSRHLVPVLVFLGMVVAVVSSLGAPLIPTIAAATHVSLADAQWSLTISLLVGAVATPTMGRLGDGPHRRQVMLLALAVVAAGSALAALPLPFGYLLIGRGMMGVGLGLTPLAMATARDALSGEASKSAVALLSITGVAGIGLGYPLTGLIAEHLSFRAGFAFGAIVAVIAFAAAVLVVPSTRERPQDPLDVVGAVLLGSGIAGLLLALSESQVWPLSRVLLFGVGTALLLIGWVVHESHTAYPLVDVRLVRDRTVLTADLTALFAGMGMYVLMSLVIRFVQTPTSLGYGFGATVVIGGLVLLPFSVMSVAASKVAPAIGRWRPRATLPLGCALFIGAEILFVVNRSHLWEVFGVMGLAGLGMGCTFAALPGPIVSAVPPHETGSAMSFNVVLRYVGYSLGSALSATVLEAHTPAGATFPTNDGYTMAALIGVGVLAVAALLSAALPNGPAPADEVLIEESIVDGVPMEVR